MSHDERPRIYLDNAATSWPKPEAVYRAVNHYQRELGAPAGRSGYAEGVAVSRMVENARTQVARFVGLDDPSRLIFTSGGTDSLNLAIHGLLRGDDHVVVSAAEHNSVLRPLAELEAAGKIEVTRVPCDGQGVVDPSDIRQAIRPATRLVAVCHASNVTGAVEPVAEIARIAKAAGALVLCDAAQSVGHMKVDLEELGVDFLAASGHKGLLGPLGTGLLAIAAGVAPMLESVRQGGTGTSSESIRQPDTLPSKFEAGSPNVPGIVGLAAGIGFLLEQGLSELENAAAKLTAKLIGGFEAIGSVRVWGPTSSDARAPLVSITLEGYDPQEVALSLDAAHRIQVRPGLHCAPAMHEALGTSKFGGTVRFSLGAFTTEAEVDAAVAAVAEMVASRISV
jgi:cysteine desulfurase / selenocysteine lyase